MTPEHVTLIDTALRKVKHCDGEAIDAGERLLVQQAAQLSYKDLDLVAAKVVEAIDPDGILPADEAEHRLRRFFHLKHRRDGSWAGDFRLTPDVGQKLAALLGPLTRPQTTRFGTGADQNSGDPTSQDMSTENVVADESTEHVLADASTEHVVADERTRGQRQHDALAAVLDAAFRTPDLPSAGGTPTTLLLTMSWEDFRSEHGLGTYADGSPVSARTARRLADQADIALCFTNARGAVLDLHRTRRIATPAQTLALIARDGGCSFPGCEVAPQWCERHHVIAWYDGGETNVGNLTLVCSYHHHQFAQRGWLGVINDDGLPVWIPPRWIDQQQRPILNARIALNNWHPQDPLESDSPQVGDPPGRSAQPT